VCSLVSQIFEVEFCFCWENVKTWKMVFLDDSVFKIMTLIILVLKC